MTVYVFAGPTIERATVQAHLDAVVRAPAAFGDVYGAAREKPLAIAIIDGYFDTVAAVWHKEILWAMAEGVHVFGASSMGALRATELADFGMVGMGVVYEAFQRGELEDEDEVAVVHGQAEVGFRAASESMVNIRATMRAATAAGVIHVDTAMALLGLAKGRFYADRSYATMLHDGEAAGLSATELAALRDWLPTGRIDQKRDDALQLIRHIQAWLGGRPEPKRVAYHFHVTDAWQSVTRVFASCSRQLEEKRGADEATILEELRIGGTYEYEWPLAALRGVAIGESAQGGMRPDVDAIRQAAEQLRRALGLRTTADFDRWQKDQRLGTSDAGRFFEDQARVVWAQPMMDELARQQVVNHLRSNGAFGLLAARADAKARYLDRNGSIIPSLAEVSMTEAALWAWYFGERLGRSVPEDLELHAQGVGFRNCDELRAAVIREFLFVRDGEPGFREVERADGRSARAAEAVQTGAR